MQEVRVLPKQEVKNCLLSLGKLSTVHTVHSSRVRDSRRYDVTVVSVAGDVGGVGWLELRVIVSDE